MSLLSAPLILLGITVIGFVVWLLCAAVSTRSDRVLCDDDIGPDTRDPDVFLPPFTRSRR